MKMTDFQECQDSATGTEVLTSTSAQFESSLSSPSSWTSSRAPEGVTLGRSTATPANIHVKGLGESKRDQNSMQDGFSLL